MTKSSISQPVQPTDDRASFEKWAGREGLNIRRSEPKTKGGIPSSRFGLCPATYYFDEAECAWRAWANKPIAQPVKQQLVPLTDKQIYDLWPSECMAFCEEAAEFARAIEAHHGIKPAGTQPIRTPK